MSRRITTAFAATLFALTTIPTDHHRPPLRDRPRTTHRTTTKEKTS